VGVRQPNYKMLSSTIKGSSFSTSHGQRQVAQNNERYNLNY